MMPDIPFLAKKFELSKQMSINQLGLLATPGQIIDTVTTVMVEFHRYVHL